MGRSTAATRRLTLADNDIAVSICDIMREVSYLNELKLAMRALCRAAQFILPWNMSFNAIEGYRHSSNYANAELNGGSANKLQALTRGGHGHLQIGRMHDIDLISEPPTPPPPRYIGI